VAKGRGRFRSRALKGTLGPAFHQNNLNYNGYNKNGADYADGVIVHGPLPVYFSILAPRCRGRSCYVELFAGKVKTGSSKMAQALPELHRRCRGHLTQAAPPNIMASIDTATLINHFPRQRKAYSWVPFPPVVWPLGRVAHQPASMFQKSCGLFGLGSCETKMIEPMRDSPLKRSWSKLRQ
jgi:hypothetical protein